MIKLSNVKFDGIVPGAFSSGIVNKKTQLLPKNLYYLVNHLSTYSPYINRLICTEIDWLTSVIDQEVLEVLDQIIVSCKKHIQKDPFPAIRVAKRRTILVIVLADFGTIFDLAEVTEALSSFAAKIIELVMDLYTFSEFQRVDYSSYFIEKDYYPTEMNASARNCGLCTLGMGKLGSSELNYSSDIDLIFLFEEEKYKPEYYSKIRSVFVIIIRKVVKAISEVTSEGYVFRVDLRLRPDPSTNPICIGVNAALRYYENFGRNWERAAFIKARAIAGDKALGKNFLLSLTSFIWRKNLDFAAIEDINDIRKKIRKQNPGILSKNLFGYNIKTGVGGIREIEFFVQTQQLIHGGKIKSLRRYGTVSTLKDLLKKSLISQTVFEKLAFSYNKLRSIEHILQLVEDSQTHSIPMNVEKVKSISILFGIPITKNFLKYVFNLLEDVNNIITTLYSQAGPDKNNWKSDRSYMNKHEAYVPYVEKWLTYRALKSERAAKLFNELSPLMAERILQTEDAINTLFYFDKFLKSLSFGVQVFSLFKANTAVLDLLIDICGAAPALAEYVGQDPSVLDVVTDHAFFLPLPRIDELTQEFNDRLSEITDYESILNCARIFVKENQFKTGVHLLKGFSSIDDVSKSFSNIAEVCLIKLFNKVHSKFAERYGEVSGLGPSLLSMGKLGSREMSINSDLDLILIYHADKHSFSTGKKSVSAQVYYSRLTQAFISAITVATGEGSLFKVDMRLRPSGNKGPVATSISSFEHYQINDVWVWERLALSRGRVLTGHLKLCNRINGVIKQALNSHVSSSQVLREVNEMRLRINKNVQKIMLLADLKLGYGKLQDLELLIQMGALLKKSFHSLSPYEMIHDLNEKNFFSADEAQLCQKAYWFYFSLQQMLSITVAGQIRSDSIESIEEILKTHNFLETPKNIDVKLNSFSEAIDALFKSKLLNE